METGDYILLIALFGFLSYLAFLSYKASLGGTTATVRYVETPASLRRNING